MRCNGCQINKNADGTVDIVGGCVVLAPEENDLSVVELVNCTTNEPGGAEPNRMRIELGSKGLEGLTFQDPWPVTVPCVHCGGIARPAVVLTEKAGKGALIADLHDNDPDGESFWVHVACAIAVYFCKKCLKPTALMKQG